MKTSSMLPLSSQGGHSARVNMRLLINGHSLPLAQMGSDFIYVNDPIDHPPAIASLVLKIDDDEERWQVRLPAGMSANDQRVTIAPVA